MCTTCNCTTKNLKILIPVDIGRHHESNPYSVEMIRALDGNPGVDVVQHGTFWLENPNNDWSVVHFQWPEQLLDSEKPSTNDIEILSSKIDRLKRTAKIVTTVHNLQPHYDESKILEKLYRLVFRKSDAFVHFANPSVGMINVKYPMETEGKPHFVIPHGNYRCFGEMPSQSAAREHLKLPQKGTIVIVFGQLRSSEEFYIAERAIRKWNKSDQYLLISGRLPVRVPGLNCGRLGTHIIGGLRSAFFFLRTSMSGRIILHERRIPSQEVSTYCAASDIFFIPRPSILNSGNLYLGFTYGRVVVGPDVGNTGEILRKYNNPVFDPHNLTGIPQVLDQALNAIQEGVGDMNRRTAHAEWDWDKIAEKYVEMYKKILHA